MEHLEIRGQVELIQTTVLLWLAKNTEKSPEDLRRLAVTLTSVKDSSANADGKNSQKVNCNNNHLGMLERFAKSWKMGWDGG